MTTRYGTAPTKLDDFPVAYARTARFTLGTPRNVSVVDEGRRVLFCRSKDPYDPVQCLWSLDVATGTEQLVIDPTDLAASGADLPPAERARRERARESAAGIVAYSLDAEASSCCFALAGALFVVDLATGAVAAPDTPGAVFDPRLNRQGTMVAYVDGSALRVQALDDPASDRALRAPDEGSDSASTVSYGRSEFVAAEEMGRSRGYWWAPDGTALLVARVDESPVPTWWIADPAHPDRPPRSVRYPAAGAANAEVGLELVTLDGRGRPVDWSDGGRFEYLADVVWQSGHRPLVVRQTRHQRLVSVGTIDLDLDGEEALEEAVVGDEPLAVTEHRAIEDDVWVELIAGSPRWSSAGLLTIEDGEHARRLLLDGEPLTGDDLNVRSIVGTMSASAGDAGDQPTGDSHVIVTAWSTPTDIHPLAIALPSASDSSGDRPEPQVLAEGAGVHGAVVGGSTVVVTSATPERPGSRLSVQPLAVADDGTLTEASPASAIDDRSAEPGFDAAPDFTVLGSDELPSAVFLPTDHDGERPLPVLLDPYGGPHAQRVLRAHNPHLVSRWFAEQGFAVIVTDGRGTPGRGPRWERAVAGDLAQPVLDDQVAALEAALERHPFLDGDRVGIRGWSFGGFLAALAVIRRPDRFHAAIAGAPVTTWSLYDTHYTERYLGHPDEAPDHYRRSDLWDVDGDGRDLDLQRPMLLIHGLADDNVVAAHTLRFSTALLVSGSPHRVLPLSGVTHMTPQEAVAENLLRLQLDFLRETIG